MKAASLAALCGTTFRQWRKDRVLRLGAAVAFYVVLSLVPLFVLAVALASDLFGREASTGRMIGQIESTLGKPLGQVLGQMLHETRRSFSGISTVAFGLAVLLFGAFQTFGELEAALNVIFQVAPREPPGFWRTLLQRFVSLQMVIGGLLFLFVSLLAPVAFGSLAHGLAEHVWGGPYLWITVHEIVVFALVWLLFGLIYKTMPDARLAWGDVWMGAGLTAALFIGARHLLSLYLARVGLTAEYGVAQSFVVILLWVYYSCQILLFGAEFTRAYAGRYGSGVRPAADAVREAS